MRALTIILCFAFLCGLGRTQVQSADIAKSMPPFELPTKKDDKGQLQWGEYQQNCAVCKAKKVIKCMHCDHMEKPEFCVECKKTRKAPCRACGGKGELPDPLELAPCPGCNGHGVLVCHFCGNKGKIFLSNGGKSGQKCKVCKGHGGVECDVCDGKRFVDSAFRGKVGSQKLKKLVSAKKNLSALIRQVESFAPKGKAREDRKKFAGFFKKTKSDFVPLKKLQPFVDGVIKRLEDRGIKDNDKTQKNQWRRSQGHLIYYLLHQQRVIDLCIARAEANAAAAKKK